VKKKNFIWIGSIVALLLTASWKHVQAPSSFVKHAASFVKELKGVQITTKKYTAEESKAFLTHNFGSLGYIPIEITIQNNTAKSYALSAASVPLACDRGKDVAWKVAKKGMPRAVGFKIAALLFWPFAIPDAINSIHAYKSHNALKKDLTAKTLKEEDEIIVPYASVKRVLYVKEDAFQEEFSVSLQEIDGDEFLVIPTAATEIQPS
jgi:hypothetical protein